VPDFGNRPKQSSTDRGWLHAVSWFCLGLLLIATVAGIIALFYPARSEFSAAQTHGQILVHINYRGTKWVAATLPSRAALFWELSFGAPVTRAATSKGGAQWPSTLTRGLS
jgi:hypothetical protein